MLRGVLFAALACLSPLGSTQPPHQQSDAYRASGNVGPNAPLSAHYRGKYSNRCYYTQDHDRAELSAEWRSAVATEKAACEARRANRLAKWSLAVGVVGLLLILLTLRNEHISKRPYVFFFRTIKERDPWTGVIKRVVGVNFRNVGQSFARVDALTVRLSDVPCPDPLRLPLERYPPSAAIIPTEEWPFKGRIAIEGDGIDPPVDGTKFVYGRMLYGDSYGRSYHLWFCRVYVNGSFGFDQHKFRDLESKKLNGNKRIGKMRAWWWKWTAIPRTS